MDRQCSSCGGFCRKSGCERENVKPEQEPVSQVEYTAPPQREWQGLTDEEIGAMEKEYLFGGKEFDDEIGYWAVYRAIEAKLKEKNT